MSQFIIRRETVIIWKTRSFIARPDTHRAGDRNFGLDLLRAAAILLVLVCHGEYLFYDRLPAVIGNNLAQTGHWGVQLFFVLSGFLIGTIFINEIYTKGFNRKVVFSFWKRRWFRTLPNYYLFLIIYAALLVYAPAGYLLDRPVAGDIILEKSPKLVPFIFFSQNLTTTNLGFFGHSWSLAVEEWFYLSLPFTFWLSTVIFGKKHNRTGKKLALAIMIMTLVFITTRFVGLSGVFKNYDKHSVIYNLDNLMIGVGLAWIMTNYKAQLMGKKNLLLILGISLFLVGLVLQNTFILTGHPDLVWDGIIIPLQSFAFASILPWFYALKLKKRTWWSRLVTEISLASYSMYLVHYIVLTYVVDRILHKYAVSTVEGSICLFLLFGVVTLCVSSLNYRLFEKPMTSLRERFSAK